MKKRRGQIELSISAEQIEQRATKKAKKTKASGSASGEEDDSAEEKGPASGEDVVD